MRILVIGGSGTISTAVVARLLDLGWEITLLNRGSTEAPVGTDRLVADINDEATLREKLAGRHFDVVAQFIAFRREAIERDIRLFEGRCGQFIFISSASAYQKPLSRLPITESTPLCNPFWQYSRDKIACEESLVARYRATGFPVTIVRPSHTYSERGIPLAVNGDNGSWSVVQRILDGRPVLVHGDGSSLWTFTHSSDFARGFCGLCGNPHAIGEAVHITSDESLTWNDAYRAVARALDRSLNIVYAPSDLLAAAGKSAGYDLAGSLLGDKAHSVVFDNSKLKRLVPGFTATVRYDEGVRLCVENAMTDESLRRPDPDFDAFTDRVIATMEKAKAELN